MQTLKTWIIGAVIAIGFLVIGALEDKPVQDQIAADESNAAQVQAKVDHEAIQRKLKADQAYMNHLLGLDRTK